MCTIYVPYYSCVIILCTICTILPLYYHLVYRVYFTTNSTIKKEAGVDLVIGAHDGILPYDGYNSDITDMSIKTRAGQDIGLEMMLDLTLEWTRSEVRS